MEEDEVDILGEYSLHDFLGTKNDQKMNRAWNCYDNESDYSKDMSSAGGSISSSGSLCHHNIVISTLPESVSQKSDFGKQSSNSQSLLIDNFCYTSDTVQNNWSDKECYLLEKGLELFGRSWSRLSQYIGTKTSQQVRQRVKSMSTLNCVNCNRGLHDSPSFGSSQLEYGQLNDNQVEGGYSELLVLDDAQIPASFEEVISTVTTAKPTVNNKKVSQKRIGGTHLAGRRCSQKMQRPKCTSMKGKKDKSLEMKKQIDLLVDIRKGKSCSEALKTNEKTSDSFEDSIAYLRLNRDCNSIQLPTGEEIIRLQRKDSALGIEEDVDVENDLDLNPDKSEKNFSDTSMKVKSSMVFEKDFCNTAKDFG